MAIKRLYVPRRRYDEIVSGLEATLSRLVVGSGLEDGVTMGPSTHGASATTWSSCSMRPGLREPT
jgi:acyl-CoA reductase-like NAD-dependent aldehyde dehydrogenase